jgi:arylsulfatase A-like enzyme
MTLARRMLFGSLAGAAAALLAWALDLRSLSRLSFAGATDAAAQALVVAATQATILSLETRLALAHLLAGALCGALMAAAAGAWLGGRTRTVVLTGVAVSVLLVVSQLAMLARYPQLYVDRYWLAGGWYAWGMRVATHVIGPWPFEAVLVLLATWVAARCGLQARAHLSRWPRGAWVSLAAIMATVLAVAWFVPRRPRSDPRPNVLILAIESLRGDRFESPQVMPFSTALAKQGTLFRYAFVPIARTFPSWVSTLTGTEPRHNRVRTMFPREEPRQELGPTFVSTLRDEDYRTFLVADFAGDIFPRFPTGFEQVDAPSFTVDRLATATVLAAHQSFLPLLRLGFVRRAFPEWRNLATLADPEWLSDRALMQLDANDGRPFLGLVFYGSSHFPFAPAYPDYLRGAGSYRGRFLYDAPPTAGASNPSAEDIAQIRERYDGSLAGIDRALARVWKGLERRGQSKNTIVVVTGDHGEDLFDERGFFGHGDTLGMPAAQSVPLLLVGPQLAAGHVATEQVRLLDMGATLLGLIHKSPQPVRFGDGVSLLAADQERPLCLETGIWFWPDLPVPLRGRRLTYPAVSELLEVLPHSREMALKSEFEIPVETFKERGLVLGDRFFHQRLTPVGLETAVDTFRGPTPASTTVDLAALFEQRCVAGDPHLRRFQGALVYEP